jgi:hypothetical protein
MKRTYLFTLATLVCAGAASAQIATMPPHASTFTGATRGYYFIAPTDLTITGVQVQLPTGATNAFQNFAIVRFDNATPPPIYTATTNAFVQLALGLDLDQTVFQPVNVAVQTGDVIGVYGNTATAAGTTTGQNSYTATTPQSTTTIGTHVVNLARSGMQFHLGSATSPQGMHDIFSTTAFQVSRVEFSYTLGSGGVGTAYCGPAVVNSTGNPGIVRGTGSDVLANNDLSLVASDLPQNSFGFFLTSTSQGSVAQPGGSQGVLCLSGSIGRYVGPGQIMNSGATGSFSIAVNNTQLPSPTGPVVGAVGQTWNFQAWYRDAVGGTPTSNFTDGLSVTFQ